MNNFKPVNLKKPKSLDEAVSILHELEYSARIVAGNTTLHELAHSGVLEDVTTLVDISGLGLNYVRRKDIKLCVGAMTTFYEITKSEEADIGPIFALKEVAKKITTYQIRNMATVGGALASGIPFYDLPVVMMALEAKVVTKSVEVSNEIGIDEFFIANFITALGPSDMIVEVQIPISNATGSSFVKLGRISNDFAIVNCSALVSIDIETRKIAKVRIALGGISATPVRHKDAEDFLVDKPLTRDMLTQASKIPFQIEMVDSVQGSANYKRLVVPVLVRDALIKAAERIGIGGIQS